MQIYMHTTRHTQSILVHSNLSMWWPPGWRGHSLWFFPTQITMQYENVRIGVTLANLPSQYWPFCPVNIGQSAQSILANLPSQYWPICPVNIGQSAQSILANLPSQHWPICPVNIGQSAQSILANVPSQYWPCLGQPKKSVPFLVIGWPQNQWGDTLFFFANQWNTWYMYTRLLDRTRPNLPYTKYGG